MIKGKKILAIIPARGGSKRLPGKNIALLAGKPLIAHTIETAQKSQYIDRIVVSTDDKKIADVSQKYGAEIIERPKEFAEDQSPVHQAVEHALSQLVKTHQYIPDFVVLLQPTSPLRTIEDISRALDLFLKNPCESVISISESGQTNGAIFISTPALLKKYKSFYQNNTLNYVMPDNRSVDIDDEEDFKLAGSLIQKS